MMLMAAERKRRGGRPRGRPNKAPNVLGRTLSANAKRLLALRQQHNLTQSEMAALLGVKMDTVSKWERGAINVPDRVVMVADALLGSQKKKR